MVNYAVNLDFWDRIQPKIRQWEITHGRTMPKQQYQALVEGELSVATNAAKDMNIRGRALNLEEERLALAKEQVKAARSAAKIKGITDIATTGALGYLAYKAVDFGTLGAPAIDMAEISTGVFAAPTAKAAGFTGLGGQAALSKTAPILATKTAFPAEAAATEALAEGTTAVATPGFGTMALVGGAEGYAAGWIASKALGANEDISQALKLGGAGIGIGLRVGGPVGAVIGGLIGIGASLFDDSVVCSELYRQGRITYRQRAICVIYRIEHIDDRMFAGYIEWAGPHVSAMRQGGWRNSVRLPFAHAFVNYMIKKARNRKPSWFERMVFAYAWSRCEKIADRINSGMEVLCGIF